MRQRGASIATGSPNAQPVRFFSMKRALRRSGQRSDDTLHQSLLEPAVQTGEQHGQRRRP
jgi:hypothetical protein